MRYNQEAEECCLGAAMTNREVAKQFVADLEPMDFHVVGHQNIAAAIIELHHEGMTVDYLTVSDVLKRQGTLDGVGGIAGVMAIQVNIPGVSTFPTYASIVRRESTARKLLHAVSEASRSLSEGAEPISVADQAERALRGLDRGGQLPERYWRDWDHYAQAEHLGAGVPLIAGVTNQHTRIILLAAEKLGKSMLSRQIAFCAAAGIHPWTFKPMDPVRVLVLDAENDDDELVPTSNRLLAMLARTPESQPLRPSLLSAPYGLDLRSRRDRSELEEVLEDCRPQLIVGGPIYKLLPQDHQTSDPRHAEELQHILDDVRKRWGCALILEHHAPAGKPGGEREIRSVGGQRWAAWPEVTIALYNSKDPQTPDSAEVRFPHPTRGKFRWPKRFDRGKDYEWPWMPVLRSTEGLTKEEPF